MFGINNMNFNLKCNKLIFHLQVMHFFNENIILEIQQFL